MTKRQVGRPSWSVTWVEDDGSESCDDGLRGMDEADGRRPVAFRWRIRGGKRVRASRALNAWDHGCWNLDTWMWK